MDLSLRIWVIVVCFLQKKSQNKNSAIARKSAFIRYVLPQTGKEEGPKQIVDASLM
jgi:hypothetical protein